MPEGLSKKLKEWYAHRFLVRQLIMLDLKTKYKGSFLGIFWSLLEPLSIFTIMFLVFSTRNGSIQFFPLFLLSGIITWRFFTDSSSKSLNRMLGNSNLIKKIKLPSELLVISGVISSSINYFLELSIIVILLIYYKVFSGFYVLFFIPYFLIFFIMNLGLSFFLSSTNVFMRDVKYIWNVILKAGFFATPIFYELSKYPEKIQFLITLNPVTGLVNFFRETIIYGTNIPLMSFGYSCLFSIAILIIGYATFNHYKKKFAEEL